MLEEKPQSVSTQESLLYCALGTVFVYFVWSVPLLLFRLFPPTPPAGITITYGVATPPDIAPFIIGFGLFTIIGIYLLQRLQLKNQVAHLSLLVLIVGFGGGILTCVLEGSYYLFWSGDSLDREIFFRSLRENWLRTLFFEFKPAGSVIFLLTFIPFIPIYVISKSIVKRFARSDSLR